jgi:hypothetical protein
MYNSLLRSTNVLARRASRRAEVGSEGRTSSIYLIPSDTKVLEIYLLKNLKCYVISSLYDRD